MILDAQGENAHTLASVLGLDEERACELLEARVLLTSDGSDASHALAECTRRLLGLTLKNVEFELAGREPDLEIIFGAGEGRSSAPKRWAAVSGTKFEVADRPASLTQRRPVVHPILLELGACHVSAAAVHAVVGEELPSPCRLPITLDLDGLLGQPADSVLTGPVDLGTAYLAGAGAVGNAFLHALRLFDVRGQLHVVDPKVVAAGNLNRCLWFRAEDVGADKAPRLVERARGAFPHLDLVAHGCTMDSVPAGNDGGPWLERLIVGVDSRRARRGLQELLPRDVFDTSTTGIREVVLSFNGTPGRAACLGCVYIREEEEVGHEAHVAEVLGVPRVVLREVQISPETAAVIVARYQQLAARDLVGRAYDSLFKQLCAEAVIKADDRRVLAPFAFVSALAGAYLTLELVRRIRSGDVNGPFNYWALSPWSSPVFALRDVRPRAPDCEVCGRPELSELDREFWG